MAQQIPLLFVSITPIMKILYVFVILFCLLLEWYLGSTAFILSRQKMGRLDHLTEGERGRHRNQTWRMHTESQSPCSMSRSWYSKQWLTPSSVPLKSDSDPPEQKLLLVARCLCGNLKMWFSVEHLQYSKMLLFLLSLPFIYSEPGRLTWVTRSYFCFFLLLFLTKQMYDKRTEYLCSQKQPAQFQILELQCKN